VPGVWPSELTALRHVRSSSSSTVSLLQQAVVAAGLLQAHHPMSQVGDLFRKRLIGVGHQVLTRTTVVRAGKLQAHEAGSQICDLL
jgi:hypothetical protein